MAARRVFIVGDSLFAESLAKLLARTQQVQVVATCPAIQGLLSQVDAARPDAIIVAGVVSAPDPDLAQFLSIHPEVPVICTDLGTNSVQVILSQRILVHSSGDLLAAIESLPDVLSEE